MSQRKTKEDDGMVLYTVRLEPETVAEIRRRATIDRRPASQWLRNFINDALQAKKVVK